MRLFGGDRAVRVGVGTVLTGYGFVDLAEWLGTLPPDRFHLLHNPVFDGGIASSVVGVLVLVSALPWFSTPKLKLVFESTPEFNIPLIVNTPAVAGMVPPGAVALAAMSIRVRVDEERGVAASRVHVRLASVTPPHPMVPPGELLPWWGTKDERYGEVPAKSHNYVTLATIVTLQDGRPVFAGPLVGLQVTGQAIRIVLEVWWGNRKLDTLEHFIATVSQAPDGSFTAPTVATP